MESFCGNGKPKPYKPHLRSTAGMGFSIIHRLYDTAIEVEDFLHYCDHGGLSLQISGYVDLGMISIVHSFLIN